MNRVVRPFPRQKREVAPQVHELNTYCAKTLAAEGKWEAAVALTKRGILVEPTSCELWANLGTYLWNLRRYRDSILACEQSLEFNPDYHIAFGTMALCYEGLHDLDKAEHYINAAIEARDPRPDPTQLADLQFNRSLLRLKAGNYRDGFAEYDARITRNRLKGNGSYPKPAVPQWEGEPLEGKSLYLLAEQGVGDTILFSRFLPWLASLGGKIYLWCASELVPLLWHYRQYVEFLPTGVPIPAVDYHVFMGSLPRLYNCTLDCVPPDVGLVRSRIQEAVKQNPVQIEDRGGFKIGFCWSGNPLQERNFERSIPMSKLLDLLQHPKTWGYSLQVGPAQADIKRFGAETLLNDLSPQLVQKGFCGTGTAIAQLDLVITCCTSVAHLAAAVGTPCWVLLCADPYWIWPFGKDRSPWWPNVRLFRQHIADDWDAVLQDVNMALSHSLGGHRDG